MANGRIKRIAASGRRPASTIEKIIKQEAMALREAKNPLVVDNKPTKARAKEPRPMSGERKVLSTPPPQAKNGAKASLRLPKNEFIEKLSASSKLEVSAGCLMHSMVKVVNPATMITIVVKRAILESFLTVKRKCGLKMANRIINMAR